MGAENRWTVGSSDLSSVAEKAGGGNVVGEAEILVEATDGSGGLPSAVQGRASSQATLLA